MGKSVYSVMLTDDVVAAVDALAYQTGISRSRMIDRILAQHVCCETPAQQMADIFRRIEEMANFHSRMQLLFPPSQELLQLKSAVPYKYNPTVKYAVYLTPEDPLSLGQLRVSLRSQSTALRSAMNGFYRFWANLEEQHFHEGRFLSYRIDEDRYERSLRRPNGLAPAEQGDAIAAYLSLFDATLKAYFDGLPNLQEAARSAYGVFGSETHPKKNAHILAL